MRWHYPVLLILLVGAVVTGMILASQGSAPPDDGQDGDGNTSDEGHGDGKAIYYYFYSDGCPACKVMEDEILSNRTVITKLEAGFHYEKINTAKNANLAQKYNIIYVPTSVFAYADGTEITRRVGAPPDTEIFLTTLQDILDFVNQGA
jgi:thiol-disulfide isomerase/thioredoxin